MVWLLFFALSCVIHHDYLHEDYLIDKKLETFVIGSPVRKSTWLTEPDVRICSSTEVSAFRTRQAVRFWERLGYRFGSIFVDDKPDCMNARFGEILITLPEGSFAGTHMASTKIYTRIDNNKIVKAKIFIMPKYSRKERVLEHEIGHALGWSHYNQKFHIMHPNWFLGGFDTKGLRD